MSVHHIEVPGVTLRVDDIGYGAPVVMLPGMLCDASLYDAQARALSAYCRVIRPDWRGHGYSTDPGMPPRAPG
jgi:pimeloyl-ACP methyl ester carboxylesterase